MESRVDEIDAEINRLADVCAALGASSPQSNDHVIWRSLERDVEACTENLVKQLAQAAIQHDEERSRLLMERLDRVDALARRLRQRSVGAKAG
jgi:uncharacterized protein YcgI (DUF1989 family)